MARQIDDRLTRLKNRRTGMDRYDRLDTVQRLETLSRSMTEDRWQRRVSADKPHTRYALGAMQEVGDTSTRISLETAERVGSQLNKGFKASGRDVEFRLQGSVPLNVHIRQYSDVDLLTVDLGFMNYDRDGARALQGFYFPSSETTLARLMTLRASAEQILVDAFPAANVDRSCSKAINISGGSLPRSVDVVPSCWYDTAQWQSPQSEIDRAVKILDKARLETPSNWPFLHIDRISMRCATTAGGMRKGIRLAKSVKCDAGSRIDLSSFDIAGLIYHADRNGLIAGAFFELAILAEVQWWFDYLYRNPDYARSLVTPDGSRQILNTQAKVAALGQLSIELDDLLRNVAREQAGALSANDLSTGREAISKVYIADAA